MAPVAGPTQHDHAGHACCDHDHHGQDGARAIAPPDPRALVSGRGIHVRRGGRVILENVDLDIAGGEIVTLIGPNGAGKTTMVRVMLGLERPDRGTLLRRKGLVVGYVPQRLDIDRALPMTVARFLALGTDAERGAIVTALREVGAPHVIDTQLASLSGGETQRVFLARALLRDPGLLVLDEPVRGVDQVGEAELYRLIGRLRSDRGFGILLVSHDLHIVMAASDRVVCLNRHVCCSGVPTSVARHPEYERLFGAPAARTFAVYEHHHDHAHDLAGAPVTGTAGPQERDVSGESRSGSIGTDGGSRGSAGGA
ncbi:MAG: metal ABC transporter ATP-binding protein [Hyphomicrobiaceae bacterium]|nr:metal ABC transporter ATP-binding protein [Hyphomicrobiaceae bacterium]